MGDYTGLKELVRPGTYEFRAYGTEGSMLDYDEAAGELDYTAYVNIGGGLGSMGSSQVYRLLRAGLSRNLGTKNFPRRGTLVRMAQRGMPVIHVPNANRFIERYDLAEEPVPRPEVGTGGVFYRDRYNVPLAGVLAVLYGFLIFAVVRIDLKHYLFRVPQKTEEKREERCAEA